MGIGRPKWLGVFAMLAGCAASPQVHEQMQHDVRFLQYSNAFLQTQEAAAWSIRFHADQQGNRWPTGLTLSAAATLRLDHTQRRTLILRKEEASAHAAPAVYERAREQRRHLRQRCNTVGIIQDGRLFTLPASSITVRPLTNRGRMPVPSTDTMQDPIEIMVGENTSENFVLSTAVQADVDRVTWLGLANARLLTYELCGETSAASSAELEGLRKVIAQSRLWAETGPRSPPAH